MRFDLSEFHLLLQAFDIAGRHLYGKDWRGDEAFARDTEDPAAVSEERRDLQNRLKALEASAAPYRAILAADADEDEHQLASDALHHITHEQHQVKESLATLPHVTGSWLADHGAFTRRKAIEAELFGGFRSGDLSLQVGPREIVQWRSWSREPDFKVLFAMSSVILPRSHAGLRRRGPAFVQRAAFNKWLDRFQGADADIDELTPESQLQVWLRDRVNRFKPKEFSKADYKAKALEDVPGLSKRVFDRIWAETVPDSWKQSGRRYR